VLKGISTATITLQLLNRGIRNTYVRSVAPFTQMLELLVGEALTLRSILMCEDLLTTKILVNKQNLQRVTLATIPKGVVLVIDVRRGSNCTALGEVLAEWIKQWGGAGIVTDGCV
jgi:regulator of RNase E activity RraA